MPVLSTAQILEAFTQEIQAQQGEITDTYDDGERLLVRSVLPQLKEVRPDDQLQGGVALRGTSQSVWLHPYLFRLICKNGAIAPQAVDTQSLLNLNQEDPETTLQFIREGTRACCAPEVFTNTVTQVLTAAEMQINFALAMLPLLKGLPKLSPDPMVMRIVQSMFTETDKTAYGLANVITAIARDTTDPVRRWDLEELGGSLIIGKIPTNPNDWFRALGLPCQEEPRLSKPSRRRTERERKLVTV